METLEAEKQKLQDEIDRLGESISRLENQNKVQEEEIKRLQSQNIDEIKVTETKDEGAMQIDNENSEVESQWI